jgi:hypothetical protein
MRELQWLPLTWFALVCESCCLHSYLEFFMKHLGALDVVRLPALGATAEQDDNLVTVLREVYPISWPPSRCAARQCRRTTSHWRGSRGKGAVSRLRPSPQPANQERQTLAVWTRTVHAKVFFDAHYRLNSNVYGTISKRRSDRMLALSAATKPRC